MSQNHNFIDSVAQNILAKQATHDLVLLPNGNLIKHLRLSILKHSKTGACIMPNIFSYNQMHANLHCFTGFCKDIDLSEIRIATQFEMLSCFEKIGVENPISVLTFYNTDIEKFKEKYSATYEKFSLKLNAQNLFTPSQANKIALRRIQDTWIGGSTIHIIQSNIPVPSNAEILDFFNSKSEVIVYKNTILPSHTNSILECENTFEESTVISLYIREHLEKEHNQILVVCENRNLVQLIKNQLSSLNISSRHQIQNLSDSASFTMLNAIMNFDDDFKLSLTKLLKSYLSRFKNSPDLEDIELNCLRKPYDINNFDDLFPIIPENHFSTDLKKLAELLTLIDTTKTFKDFTTKVFDVFNFIASFELIDSNEADAVIQLKDAILDSKLDFVNTKLFRQTMEFLARSQIITTQQIHEPLVEFISLDELEFYNPKTLIVAGATTELINELSQKQLIDSFQNCLLTYAKFTIDEENDSSLFYSTTKDSIYHKWLTTLNTHPTIFTPRPAPTTDIRPIKYSASGVELLMSDPYIFYVKYVLKLKELESINLRPSRREFGLAMHYALSKVTSEEHQDERKFKDKISNEFKSFLVKERIKPKPYWEQKMIRISSALFQYFSDNPFHDFMTEVYGEKQMTIDDKAITLNMRADRIDTTTDNTKIIYDYKTGAAPEAIDVKSGKKPQMLIGAYIFGDNAKLTYLSIYGKKDVFYATNLKYDLKSVEEGLQQLFTTYMKSHYYAQIHFDGFMPWAFRHINRYDEWYN